MNTPEQLAEWLTKLATLEANALADAMNDAALKLLELAAENAVLQQKLSACVSRCNAAVGQADALRADAERLRFCIDSPNFAICFRDIDDAHWNVARFEQLDAAMMKETP
jgi:hypothetical protein